MEYWDKKKIMFVYGSLRKGFSNHYLMEESVQNKNLGGSFIRGYKLYSLRVIPTIKYSGNPQDKVFVEKYSLIEPCFEKIDRMEQGAGYTPFEVVDNEGVKGIIYIYQGKVEEKNRIESGLWKKEYEKIIVEEPKK